MKKVFIIAAACFFSSSILAGWKVMTSPVTANLRSISYVNSDAIYVAGSEGVILRYDGEKWLEMESGTDLNLNAISMSSDTEGWAAGVEGVLQYYSEGEWSEFPMNSNMRTFNAILTLASDDVYFLSYDLLQGSVLHRWDGTKFSDLHTFSDNLTTLAADSPDNIWVAGGTNQIFHYNGTSWDHSLSLVLPETIKIFRITLNSSGYPIVTGVRLPGWDLDLVYEYSPDTGWVELWNGYEKRVVCAAVNKTRGFAMGAGGRVIEHTIFGWNETASLSTRQINDVVLPCLSEGLAVTDLGGIFRFQQPSIRLDLNTNTLNEADFFEIEVTLRNPESVIHPVMEIIMLEAYGTFWFWPSWSDEFDCLMLNLEEKLDRTETLFAFTWPSGAGSGQAAFWGALLNTNNTILGYDIERFKWSD